MRHGTSSDTGHQILKIVGHEHNMYKYKIKNLRKKIVN